MTTTTEKKYNKNTLKVMDRYDHEEGDTVIQFYGLSDSTTVSVTRVAAQGRAKNYEHIPRALGAALRFCGIEGKMERYRRVKDEEADDVMMELASAA